MRPVLQASHARSTYRALRVAALAGVFALAALVLFSVAPAFAQTDGLETVRGSAGYADTDITTIIGTIINVVLGFLGVVFLLLLIYSGFTWMTAGGDDERVKKAKKTLINATVGIIITVSAYAIATFIMSALGDATGINGGGNGSSSPVPEVLSGSLGSGPIRDHYPERNATGIARNTRIMVTFKQAMNVDSFVTDGALNTDNIHIYNTAEGEDAALTDVTVSYTDDLTTFVFDPDQYLGSATADTTYTVSLGTRIETADGEDAFSGSYAGGYEWSFEVSTELDLDPPSIVSITPSAAGTYDRNITVEVTFDEAIDPTSATGTRESASGFQNIQTTAASASSTLLAGTYEISNAYRTVTFTSSDACGTNSCGETIYCLPGNDTVSVDVLAATAESDPPQADSFPYDGVVDTAANSLDGNDDGTAGDDYRWSFSTTDDINLEGAAIESISPNILAEGVELDQDITITFDDVMMSSSLISDNVSMENYEQSTGSEHEMWYSLTQQGLQSDGTPVTSASQTTVKTEATIAHGVFQESTGGLTYLYSVLVGEGVRNQYQNCYSPAEGPTEDGGACGVDDSSPSCCNGAAGADSCDFFTAP